MFEITIAFAVVLALQDAPPSTKTPPASPPEVAEPAPQQKTFSDDRLEQMVAPIALYPDALLAQITMAATYPLEVVEASRYMQANSGLTGAKLEDALRAKDWDPSVKSLCGFPDLLRRMNDDLDWLRDLGDASLSQRDDLMDAVQRMRRKAIDAGTLKSSPEMVVSDSSDHLVTIASPSTEVVYVPTYYPVYAYGPWRPVAWWYPVFFVPPPPVGPFFYFGVGIPWGFGMWGRCDWGWHHSSIQVDVAAHDRFVQRTFVDPRPVLLAPARTPIGGARPGVVAWQHDPVHRRGVNYRSPAVAQHFRTAAARPAPIRNDLRGRAPMSSPPARSNMRQPPLRPAPTQPAPARPVPQRNPSARPAPSTVPDRSVFRGVRDPARDRAASRRGNESLRGFFDRRNDPRRGHDA